MVTYSIQHKLNVKTRQLVGVWEIRDLNTNRIVKRTRTYTNAVKWLKRGR